MLQIPLSPIANQSFFLTLDNHIYEITLKETNGVMCATISRDNNLLFSNQRIATGEPLIPYSYQEDGNFIITTNNGDLPYFDQFGISQFLIYITPSELEAIYAGT